MAPTDAPTRPRTGQPRRLHGYRIHSQAAAAALSLVRQSQRRQREASGHVLARVRAIASDPHIHALAAAITELNERDHRSGGRPRHFPDWCLVLFGASIRVFGSASATARALQDPMIWAQVVHAAAPLTQGADQPATDRGPSRDHWAYFLKHRISETVLDQILLLQRDLAVQRAQEVGLLNESDRHPVGNYRRDHIVGLDGKVFSSPLRRLDTERPDRVTGDLRPVRQDPARQRYGEGGVDGIVWGAKYAIASVRSPLTNHRVILGISHFDATATGGEGRVFTDLATDLADRTSGIHAFTADGAWRGTHLETIQRDTGCGVIAPARHLTAARGGITLGRHSFAAKSLPWSTRRIRRETGCGGHQLWACAGTLYEQIIAADGTSQYTEVSRHQTKRDTTRHTDGTRRHQFYARYTLPCHRTGTTHTWWEPLLAVATDSTAKFNRAEYLRVVSTHSDQHRRLYGMRQDTESLNAQLERAFYGQRLPAWGVHNQTTIVLMAVFAENAWARQIWHTELQRQDC